MGLFSSLTNPDKVKGLPKIFTCEVCGAQKMKAIPIYRISDKQFLYAICSECIDELAIKGFGSSYPVDVNEFHKKLKELNLGNSSDIKKYISSSNTIPGKKIVQTLGLVSGTSSYNQAGLLGEGYSDKIGNMYMQNAIDNATDNMIKQAIKLGADGIISVNTNNEHGSLNNNIVTMTGTAVKFVDEDIIPSQNKSEKDPIEEIRKYKALLDDGIISTEEFEEKKKQLLEL